MKPMPFYFCPPKTGSHPARGAWIETVKLPQKEKPYRVAPREGCVD